VAEAQGASFACRIRKETDMPKYFVSAEVIYFETFTVEADSPEEITEELLGKEGVEVGTPEYSHVHEILEVEDEEDEEPCGEPIATIKLTSAAEVLGMFGGKDGT
jgi:hypothetical protein